MAFEDGAAFFVGRAFSLRGFNGFRLPKMENAVLLVGGGGGFVDASTDVLAFSHGNPGGDDGGLDARAGASEKTGGGVGLDGRVISDVGNASGMICDECALSKQPCLVLVS